MAPTRGPLDDDVYLAGVRAGDVAVLARAITLLESEHPEHQAQARRLLAALMPSTGGAVRVGVSGVPGVGKSTFIDVLGVRLTGRGHRVAVLAVDPSSAVSGGSILGDKTRMTRLARDARAFIRPSPSGGTLGGVATKTAETILLCEAAGFDVVLVETVGVGQSEAVVADMVDAFIVLMLPGAGDGLQGIKRGILEVADVVAVNKADGDQARAAERARREYELAVRLLRGGEGSPPVLAVSAKNGAGIGELWAAVESRRAALGPALEVRRAAQRVRWMWRTLEDRLLSDLRADPAVAAELPALESAVREGRTPPGAAADTLLRALRQRG